MPLVGVPPTRCPICNEKLEDPPSSESWQYYMLHLRNTHAEYEKFYRGWTRWMYVVALIIVLAGPATVIVLSPGISSVVPATLLIPALLLSLWAYLVRRKVEKNFRTKWLEEHPASNEQDYSG